LNVEQYRQVFDHVRASVGRVLIGQEHVVEHVLLAILARGHVLIDGVPGLGKTLLVRALGLLLGCEYKRVQFTPDLMPNDITGGNVFNQQQGQFVFMPGPLFTQLLLGDEINRAPAKTQSALLEAMADRSVTADGETRALPRPFFVIATQNPVEFQGTYPLPEAQLDRFLMKIHIGHPTREVEAAVLRNVAAGFDAADLEQQGLQPVVTHEHLLAMQELLKTVAVDEGIVQYITDIVGRTRAHRSIHLGASPRGSIGLLAGARARAASQGRAFVVPDDVKALVLPVLRHRIVMHPDAELEGVTPDDCIGGIVNEVVVPQSVAPA
jgi:MoxR-like ATPase